MEDENSIEQWAKEITIPPEKRPQVEKIMARYFSAIAIRAARSVLQRKHEQQQQQEQQLQEQGNSIRSISDRRDSTSIDLTPEERRTFTRSAYYAWPQAFLVGAGTFGILYGGIRYVALRRSRFQLPSRSTMQYTDLDRTSRGMQSQQLASNTTPATTSQDGRKFSIVEEVLSQLQFVLAGAISFVVGGVTATKLADNQSFYRNLSSVPLSGGRSYLCRDMCPELIDFRKQLLEKDQFREFWEDPITEELESVTELVVNCEERLNYENYLRRRNNLPDDIYVTVPSRGVPKRLLKVDDASQTE